MDIAVIGTGYVGLVTGAGLADFGNAVICCDIDERKIAALNKGEIPIYEPGLDTIVSRNVAEGRLRFTTDLPEAIRSSRAIFIAVGTPPKPDGSADLRYVEDVARAIARYMNGPKLVITKSTVPIGTGRMIERILKDAGNGHHGSVVSNPEFLREGSAIEDFMRPDRIVIGASDPESIELMKEIYAPLHSLEIPFVTTNVESSELIKYAANGFLATKISFINEVAVLCELVGGDVQDVARGIGLDGRIGSKFLQAGPGFGGSCFPKDTSALADIAKRHDYDFQLIEAVLRVNQGIKERMVVKVADALDGELRGKTIAILGLAFKPETDDMRDSPTITLIQGLQRQGALIRAYDPQAMENAKTMFENVRFCRDAYETAEGADALVIATEWNEFRALNLDRVKKLLRRPVIVDLRNVYDPQRMKSEGFQYHSVGRAEDVRVRERV
ncbi:MAG TPA: UDP-glucose/GDP-mannose dehydrogenase family protein [Thermoanaerobaculia bacterium]|nr:UDP-glucose/GDP-mannose dehydrogenase family protein [Thermoanaerobaculia bacterium]